MDRKLLKARAHSLHPMLQLGEKGLTDAVVAEIERALTHHELIKIRAAPLNRDEREVALASMCERTGALPVQHIGKIFVLYRPKPEVSAAPAPPDTRARPRARARAVPSGRGRSEKPARKPRRRAGPRGR